MTAGIPGAGIAGLFYLACALLMPVRAVVHALGGGSRRTPVYSWRFVLRHAGMAGAMLGSLWLAGWGLGWLLAAGSAGSATASDAAALPRAIGRGLVWITAGTLAGVLIAVELLRIVLGRRRRPTPAARVLLSGMLLLGPAATAAWADRQSQPRTAEVDALLARAESAFKRGALAEAAAGYEAVLRRSPRHPRALYRLGQLRRDDPARAVELFEAYTAVVPRDAWGHLALSSALADAGRHDEALAAYERADALEPGDRDIALGRPRLLARIGLATHALSAYRAWVARHPRDTEAWRELATLAERLRRWPIAEEALAAVVEAEPSDQAAGRRLAAARSRAAPAIEIGGLGIGETDVGTFGIQAGGDAAAGSSGRVGATWQRRRIESFDEAVVSDRLLGVFSAQPSADLRVHLAAGLVRRRADLDGAAAVTTAEARVRVRRRFARDRGGVDLRGQYGPVDATPALALDELTRRQVSGALELPVADRWRARGLASLWLMARPEEEANRGWRLGTSLAFEAAPAVHLSGGWQQSRARDPGVGYFAPERAELVEGAIDLERERGILTISLDAGAGIQRFKKHGEPIGAWDAALRAWGMLAWTLAPGRQFTLELEAYDSRVTDRVVAVTDRWRYASVTAGLRIAVR